MISIHWIKFSLVGEISTPSTCALCSSVIHLEYIWFICQYQCQSEGIGTRAQRKSWPPRLLIFWKNIFVDQKGGISRSKNIIQSLTTRFSPILHYFGIIFQKMQNVKIWLILKSVSERNWNPLGINTFLGGTNVQILF